MTIRVLIADDEEMVRTGLRLVLDREDDIEVVAEASDGHAALEAVAACAPDVVLMDVRMPRLDGIEATRRIARASETSTRVLVLTTFDEDEYVYEALTAAPAASCSSTRRPTTSSARSGSSPPVTPCSPPP